MAILKKFAFIFFVLLLVVLFLSFFGTNLYSLSPTPTLLPTLSRTNTPTSVPPTATPTETPLPPETETPTITPTPTATEQSGFIFPQGIVTVAQAFCRYGPGTAYLYSHDLVQDQHVEIQGRNFNSNWLLVKPDDLDRLCWSAASNFNITGDLNTLVVQQVKLPKSGFVVPPSGVVAAREGNQVTISWDAANYIPVGDRRGYLLEVNLCQNGAYFFQAIQTDNTSLTLQDDGNCSAAANGLLYIAEKHGYSEPVPIPWP